MNSLVMTKPILRGNVGNITSPVIILGSERSGTNLLRVILHSHSEIVSPPPAGFIDALMPIQARYFPEGRPDYLSQLIDDVIVMTKTHHDPWDINLDAEAIKERLADQSSLLNIFCTVNDIYAEQKGRRLWVSKEPGLFKYIREVAEFIPDAKFVYLVRDGRDVAASMLHGHLHEFHMYYAAHSWVSTQRFCLAAMADPAIKSRIHIMKYEGLLEDPQIEVSKLMQFVGLPYEARQLDFHKNKNVVEYASKSRFWKNLSKPIDRNNMGRYKQKLSAKEIGIFETVARGELSALGYQPETTEDMVISPQELRYYEIVAKIKRFIWSFDPRVEARRSRRRFAITWQIINRNMA